MGETIRISNDVIPAFLSVLLPATNNFSMSISETIQLEVVVIYTI